MRTKGGHQLKARLNALKPDPSMMVELQKAMLREQKARVQVKTGHARRSIIPGRLGPATAETLAAFDYAAALELGTRPHEIVATRAKFLRFPSKGTATTRGGRPTAAARRAGGAYTFRKRVQHPGTKPYPFMRPGAEAAIGGQAIRRFFIDRWNGAA